jgi:hypothetical protein
MNRRFLAWPAAVRSSLVATTTLTVAACALLQQPAPGPELPVYVPDIVGVIQRQELIDKSVSYTLSDGRLLSIPASLQNLGNLLTGPDRLLVAGHVPTQWAFGVLAVAPSALIPEGCYELHGRIREDASNVFITVDDARGDVLVRFSKAANFHDLGYLEGKNVVLGLDTCINAEGLAVEHH